MKLLSSLHITSVVDLFNDLEKYIPVLDSVNIKKKCVELNCDYDSLEFIIKELNRPSIII